jgi:hypothetical protein
MAIPRRDRDLTSQYHQTHNFGTTKQCQIKKHINKVSLSIIWKRIVSQRMQLLPVKKIIIKTNGRRRMTLLCLA